MTVYGRSWRSLPSSAYSSVRSACPRSARRASRRTGAGSAARNAVISAGRASSGASPGQYSWRRSSSVQSPASTAATGPRWNQVLVSVGGE